MSVLLIPDAHMRALYVCVLEMRHWVGRSYNKDQDPYSQKHFIGGSTDRGSLIRPRWSIKFQSLVKGKTYRGSAPILCCCCGSGTKHIQINKISQSRQWDCSLKFWNCRLGTFSGVEQRGMHFCGAHTISQSCVGMCVCVRKCMNVMSKWIIIQASPCHVLSSLHSCWSLSDRTRATTLACTCVGLCEHVSMRF